MKHLPLFFLALSVSALVACRPGERPPDAYARSSDPPPPGAVELTEEQYNELRAAGAMPLTPELVAEQAAREAARLEEDLKLIEAYVAEHPELGELLPADPVPSDRLRQTGDGNYLYAFTGRDSEQRQVTTHGRAWFAHTIADNLRRFPTRENQVGIYGLLYDAAPEELRRQLELASPESLEADPAIVAEEILARNRLLASPDIAAQILDSLLEPDYAISPPDVDFLTDCAQEMGVGVGSDLTGSSFDGSCDLDPQGIVANYAWSQRPHLTCVKSQGKRGTCTGFGNTSAIETLVSMTHGPRVNLSEQAYYNRARAVWAPGDFGDGLMSEDGFQKMQQEGFLLYFENQWNYNPSYSRTDDGSAYHDSCVDYTETCSDTTHQSAVGCVDIGWWKFCFYFVPEKNPGYQGYRIGDSVEFWSVIDPGLSLEWLKIALAADFTVVLGHPVTAGWDDASLTGGFVVYKPNDTILGGHGTHAVGFIDNDKLAYILPTAPPGAGGGYLIIKNSWGNCVGDGGFYYLPYQSVLDYAADVNILLGVL